MRLYDDESVRPTFSTVPFKSENDAIKLVNDSRHDLSSRALSRNIPRAIEIARQLNVGAVHIKAMSIHAEQKLPHEGTKPSGWGRSGMMLLRVSRYSYRGPGQLSLFDIICVAMSLGSIGQSLQSFRP